MGRMIGNGKNVWGWEDLYLFVQGGLGCVFWGEGKKRNQQTTNVSMWRREFNFGDVIF